MIKEAHSFPRDFTRFCPLRQAKLSFSLQFIFFALLRRNSCLIEIVSRICLSLFNFIRRLSTALHVILISSFITDVIAPLL